MLVAPQHTNCPQEMPSGFFVVLCSYLKYDHLNYTNQFSVAQCYM